MLLMGFLDIRNTTGINRAEVIMDLIKKIITNRISYHTIYWRFD